MPRRDLLFKITMFFPLAVLLTYFLLLIGSQSVFFSILAQFTVVVAISVRMLKATFEQVNPRQEQVARLLGCTAFGSFLYVTLPLAGRGILAAFILTWARAIGEFGATVMVAGTAKGKTATLPSSIYLAMSIADLPRAVTLVVILIFISLLVLFGVRLVLEHKL
ncbi:MAG: ABC transporter permease subunit [Desulfuromonadales bacterium]